MNRQDSDDAELQHWRLVRYFHDCLAAQTDWARAINIIAQRDLTTLPLSVTEQQTLGNSGELRLSDPQAMELGKRVSLSGDRMSLVLGALFLTGTLPSADDQTAKPICAPLLEVPIEMHSEGDGVLITPQESEFSLNYSLVGELLSADSEDLQDRLSELAESVPDFPIDADEFQEFWDRFRLIAPELNVEDVLPERSASSSGNLPGRLASDSTETVPERPQADRLQLIDFYRPRIPSEFRLLPATALIFGPKAGRTMSALTELRAMSEMPLSRTAFGCLFAPESNPAFFDSVEQQEVADDIFPLPLSPSQQAILEASRHAPLTVVTGPPGTGKSYTITAMVLDAICRGETVLVASQMDKAVEVVADHVESIAGPLAIARSGGRAAQRELARKVSELTGPRSRPESGSTQTVAKTRQLHFERARQIQQLEHSFSQIVESERRWSELRDLQRRSRPFVRLPLEDVSDHDVRVAKRMVRRMRQRATKKNHFIRRWLSRWDRSRACRRLGIPEERETPDDELESLLEFHLLGVEMNEIERSIGIALPADHTWQLLEEMEQQLQESAIRYVQLLREKQVRALVADQPSRAQLRDLARLLRRRREDLKSELQQGLTAELLLDAFPAWACTSRTLCEVLPATPKLFDLVIVDEASQCDLALASVALMRGKRAVVVGDPNQLRHVCFLSRAREQASMVRHEITEEQQQRFHYRRSLFDVASDMVDARNFFFLDEHFRSHPHIIDFSNRRFYDGAMSIMTGRPSTQNQAPIQTRLVEGQREANSSINHAEIKQVLNIIGSLIESREPVSIGVVSPFRDQADAIRDQLVREQSIEVLDRHAVVVGTAHSLQGDEKDIVIMSTSIDPSSHPASLRFLESPNLFNVAITRARKQLILVTSVRSDSLPPGLLREFLLHAEAEGSTEKPSNESACEIERTIKNRLADEQVPCWTGFQTAGTRIDVVAIGETESAAVLCDHVEDLDPDQILQSHRRLTRAGWPLVRVSHRSVTKHWEACHTRILQQLRHPPHD